MVIQRWQSVMLLFAVILMGLFIAFPMLYGADGTPLHVYDNIGYLILNAAVTLLLAIDIFLYNNLKLQIRVAAMCLVLMAVSVGLGCVAYFTPGIEYSFFGVPCVIVAMVMTWFGRRMMQRDRRLLAAADRIR